MLVGFDEASREIEAQPNALSKKLESEHRAAQEMEIAKQVQTGLSPDPHLQSARSTMRAPAFRLARWVVMITIF
ncbi:MAG TPA: hypothetical protein VN868_11255 [Terriglobales bacterium]|nr:hypothetical protein [Terriglobales bacterium]